MANKQKQSFMHGALILMIGGILVKIIGALYKIPLGGVLGPRGMGYFNIGYQIYTIMYIATTSALPVAISRLVSENNAKGRYLNSRRISNDALMAYMVFGVVLAFGGVVFSQQLADFMHSPNARYAIMLISVSLIFEVIMSSSWGYFQGFGNMKPTAVTQIIIALGKLIAGLGFAYLLAAHVKPDFVVKEGDEVVEYVLFLNSKIDKKAIIAAGAICGTTIGTMVGSIYITIKKLRFKPELQDKVPISNYVDSHAHLIKKLITITIPMALSSCMLSVSNFIDTVMVTGNLLLAGLGQKAAESAYGSYTGYAVVLFSLPTAVILPLGISTVPAIAACLSSGSKEKIHQVVSSALRITTVLAFPCGIGFLFMSKPILNLLYAGNLSADEFSEMIKIAAPTLSTLGIAVIFVCLALTMNYMLQALGKERIPVITMLVGGILKIATNYFLVSKPHFNILGYDFGNIHGAPIGTNICYLTIVLLNSIVLVRTLKKPLYMIRSSAKPLMASVISCGGAYLLYTALESYVPVKFLTLFCIMLAGVAYFALLIFSRALKGDDVELLPKGEKMRLALEKRGWLG